MNYSAGQPNGQISLKSASKSTTMSRSLGDATALAKSPSFDSRQNWISSLNRIASLVLILGTSSPSPVFLLQRFVVVGSNGSSLCWYSQLSSCSSLESHSSQSCSASSASFSQKSSTQMRGRAISTQPVSPRITFFIVIRLYTFVRTSMYSSMSICVAQP